MTPNFSARALKIATSGRQRSRWFKLRHAIADPRRLWAALRSVPDVTGGRADPDDRIVVIGLGVAALAFLRQLQADGYRDITIVARDDLYGGKCVNFGCMPTEFVLAQKHMPVEGRREALQTFVAGMRRDVSDQFTALGWPIVQGSVSRIEGCVVVLEDGREIAFDRLAVAMGSRYATRDADTTSAARRVSIETFWTLPPGTRVVIDGRKNVAALSLAEAARSLGLEPTILLDQRNGLTKLPSFRYLLRRIAATGVAVHASARMIRADADMVVIENNGTTKHIPYDCLLEVGIPSPTLPAIDGQTLTVYDIDFNRAAWTKRPDISFLGDSAGYFTASEAEAQAKLVAGVWSTGAPLDLHPLQTLPLSVDGPEPLCLVGAPWTLLRSDWIELDFRAIGWSKVHGHEGKLWYLLDVATGLIEAIHICHAHAKELIALARLLIDYRADDQRWLCGAVHPTSAEIFFVLAEDAKRRMRVAPRLAALATSSPSVSTTYRLPEIVDLSPGGTLPDWLSPEEAAEALLLADPRRHLAARFAIANLNRAIALDGSEQTLDNMGNLESPVTVTFDASGRCEARHGRHCIFVE